MSNVFSNCIQALRREMVRNLFILTKVKWHLTEWSDTLATLPIKCNWNRYTINCGSLWTAYIHELWIDSDAQDVRGDSAMAILNENLDDLRIKADLS